MLDGHPHPRDVGAHRDRGSDEFVDRLYDSTPGTVLDADQRRRRTVRRSSHAAGGRPRADHVAAGARPRRRGTAMTSARTDVEKYPTSAIAVLRDPRHGRSSTSRGATWSTFHVPQSSSAAVGVERQLHQLDRHPHASMPGTCGLTHHPTTPAASLATPHAPLASLVFITIDCTPAIRSALDLILQDARRPCARCRGCPARTRTG